MIVNLKLKPLESQRDALPATRNFENLQKLLESELGVEPEAQTRRILR